MPRTRAERFGAPGQRIALVAHDAKKRELCDWVNKHRAIFAQHELHATGTTGALLEKETGLPVKRCLSGPLGGDQQIGAMIVEEKIDILFFLWDPLTSQPHDPDVKALLRIAALYEIPIATLSVADLYGGKLCAALDRQHPRDLFDVKLLLAHEGITEEIRKAFLVYLNRTQDRLTNC